MQPPLHSHHIDDDVYGPLPTGIGTSQSPYPTFPSSVNDVNSAIEPDLSSFGHGHSDGSHPHSHLQNNGFHVDPELPSVPTPATRQHVVRSTPLSLRAELVQQVSRPHARAPPPAVSPLAHNATDTGQFDMTPPPASTHASWQALHDFAQSHASAHGYALSINTTAKNRSRIKLACVCYGLPKNTHKLTPETRVRKNRVSYKTGCRMWVEGKKQEDGSWLLRIGEPVHNHPGRAAEDWAVQRKRTWGLEGGRVGVGGVTAKEEKEQQQGDMDSVMGGEDQRGEESLDALQTSRPSYSLESGGLAWRIVEQEMLRKGGPGQGRDRGVGRTVQALEERLPGIRIFKRDVYNIRAQIKRARKAAGQQIGQGLNDSENEAEGEAASLEEEVEEHRSGDVQEEAGEKGYSEIDPLLVAQCNDALKSVAQQEESEVDRLRKEVDELRRTLSQRTKELEEKNSENDSLRVQVELANMALYNQRGDHGHG